MGLSSEPLEAMTEALHRDNYPNVHAVLIAKDGKLVYEEHFEGRAILWEDGQSKPALARFDRETLYEVRSVTKSVTSAVFGIAVESGAIESVDTSLFDYFPDYAHLTTPEKREVSLRDVLTMTAGFEWLEGTGGSDDEQVLYADPDPAEVVLSRPLVTEPGARYYYSGGLTTLLGLVVGRATGGSFGAYARTRLFEPLGITHVGWAWPGTENAPRPAEDGSIYVSSCCQTAWQDVEELHWEGQSPWSSVAVPSAGLWIRPRDLLKIGSLYLNGGRWNDRQIVSETWVRESLARHTDQSEGVQEHGPGVTSTSGYGYQWWHTRYLLPYGEITVHAAVGNGGQRIWIVPELDLVAIHITSNYNLWYSSYQADRLLLERIVPWALGIESGYRHEFARPARALAPGEWPSVTLPSEESARYVGTYDFADEQLEIYVEDGVLRYELPGQGSMALFPAGDHVFVAGLVEDGEPTKLYWPDERVHFVLDESGAAERYEWRSAATGEVASVAPRSR
ncbi:MAG: serine hydrolase [Gemmatimonadota bacterium]